MVTVVMVTCAVEIGYLSRGLDGGKRGTKRHRTWNNNLDAPLKLLERRPNNQSRARFFWYTSSITVGLIFPSMT